MKLEKKVGQRWLFVDSIGQPRFVCEVIAVRPDGRCAVKIVQQIDWWRGVGEIYYQERLDPPSSYQLMEGQEVPR